MRMRECLASGGIASNSSSLASVKKPFRTRPKVYVVYGLKYTNAIFCPNVLICMGVKMEKRGTEHSPLEQTLRVSSYVGQSTWATVSKNRDQRVNSNIDNTNCYKYFISNKVDATLGFLNTSNDDQESFPLLSKYRCSR